MTWICKGFTCQCSKLEHGLPSHDHNHCCVIILSLFHCWVIILPQSLLCYNPLTFQQLKLFPWICSCVKILFAHFSTDCLDLVRVSDCAITNSSCCAAPLSCPGSSGTSALDHLGQVVHVGQVGESDVLVTTTHPPHPLPLSEWLPNWPSLFCAPSSSLSSFSSCSCWFGARLSENLIPLCPPLTLST